MELLFGLCTSSPESVEITFPDGVRRCIKISNCQTKDNFVIASVVKDAGDDPDVTNGAEIRASVRLTENSTGLTIKGGRGVGIVTKPGLPVAVGSPAINPVPLRMIKEAVKEGVDRRPDLKGFGVEVIIEIPEGERLAKKTLNSRLGIIGGLSVLGTTGIVRPLSSEAWTATILSSMDVAKAMEREEIVLSTGRTSENAHKTRFNYPDECYVMMGDYIDFAIREAFGRHFKAVHLCAQWAKMLKIAMGIRHTHVRFGALEIGKALELISSLHPSSKLSDLLYRRDFNTARQLYEAIAGLNGSFFELITSALLRQVAGIVRPVEAKSRLIVHLVSYDNKIIASFETA